MLKFEKTDINPIGNRIKSKLSNMKSSFILAFIMCSLNAYLDPN